MQLGEHTWTDVEGLANRVVVAPLGSFEQHGHHLPLLTDTLIGAEVARRAEAELGDAARFLPMLWLGASHHHRTYPGTVSVANDTYVRVLVDILESLIDSGFRRILLLNSHGGNIVPGNLATYDVQLRHRDKPDLYIAFTSWWAIAAEQIALLPELVQATVTHACELETSMILQLRADLVRMEVARGATIPFDSAFYSPDSSRPSRVDVPRAFDQVTVTGALTHPELATPEKGAALFAVIVPQVVAFVREFAAWPTFAPQ